MSTTPPSISSVSLGMFLLDSITIPSRAQPLVNSLGGSAAFFTFGARLFPTPGEDERIGCLLIAGNDFPPAIRQEIEGWTKQGVEVVVRDREEQSTRGRLVYEDDTFGPKAFQYINPPLKPSPSDLLSTFLLHARAFHILATPEEILHLVPELLRLRNDDPSRLSANDTDETDGPFLVWEPLPSSCTPSALPLFNAACRLVDIFSPNHLELASLFGSSSPGAFDFETLKDYAGQLMDAGISPNSEGILLIRCGEHGAFVVGAGETELLPAYYAKGDTRVVDPTGAGNAFLGGFVAGWQAGAGDVRTAMVYGGVAASFALERIGLGVVEVVDGRILCNGTSILKRVEEYESRLTKT